MLENQSKKILLLSNDPADASFLSEIAVMQQAGLELVASAAELCSKIAFYRADDSLAAIFVDVSTPAQLRSFEYELQSKLGNTLAAKISLMVHYISEKPLTLNREVLLSPYFSFYSERKNYDFANSAKYYQYSFFQSAEYAIKQKLSFEMNLKEQCFDKIKKELLLKEFSAEWLLKFKNILDEMLVEMFPARFEFSITFSQPVFKMVFTSKDSIEGNLFKAEKFLNLGISAIISKNNLVLVMPVFEEFSAVVSAFRFFKVEK